MRLVLTLAMLTSLVIPPTTAKAAEHVHGVELILGGGPVACTESKEACAGHAAGGGFNLSAGYRFNRWFGLYADAEFGWIPTSWGDHADSKYRPSAYQVMTFGVTPRVMWRRSGFDVIAGVGPAWSHARQDAEETISLNCGEMRREGFDWSAVVLRFELGVAYDPLDWLGFGVLGSYTFRIAAGDLGGALSCHSPEAYQREQYLDTARAVFFVRFRL